MAVWATQVWTDGLLGGASTGLLMPALVGGLLWLAYRGVPASRAHTQADFAGRHPSATAAVGWSLYAVGATLAGQSADAWMLAGLGLPLSLYAGLARTLGPQSAARARFPVACLWFALPWEHFVRDVDGTLQRASAEVAYYALTLAGYSITWWDEVTLVEPDYWVVVNETCSGMNLMLTLSVYTLVYGWLTQRLFINRLWLLLLGAPLALLVNGLRVASILLLGKYGGDALAQGFWHTGGAYVLFMPVFWVLYALGRRLDARATATARMSSAGQSAQSP